MSDESTPEPLEPGPAGDATADGPHDELDADPALASVVLEIEEHVGQQGWDQPAQLYALVDTADLVVREPALASAMGLDAASAAGSLTPVEQEALPDGVELEEALQSIAWPPEVAGCAAVVERLVLPPDADEHIPDDAEEAAAFARSHPERQELRIVAAATRSGSTYCAYRFRSHDDARLVVGGTDLVPALVELLAQTLAPDEPGALDEPPHGSVTTGTGTAPTHVARVDDEGEEAP